MLHEFDAQSELFAFRLKAAFEGIPVISQALDIKGVRIFSDGLRYTGYYLNILAGDEPVRTMQPSDDPTLAWVRATWTDDINEGLASWQDIDTRINGAAGRRR